MTLFMLPVLIRILPSVTTATAIQLVDCSIDHLLCNSIWDVLNYGHFTVNSIYYEVVYL